MWIVITALKPKKLPMMFKGTKVLFHHSRKKQFYPLTPLQPTFLQTLHSLVLLSQRHQVCKARLTAEVFDQTSNSKRINLLLELFSSLDKQTLKESVTRR